MFKSPPLPPIPPPPPNPPVFGSALQAMAADRQSLAARGGIASTILTSAQGDRSPASTTRKTLLGQ